ncbi:UvrD-helicase domain-containing protein [Eshraghiella crossota]|uniref:ATP-dependent DNA helicase PcrA n=2 Tax=Eshraghiella TaxID=3342669 RepID=D4RWG4_9FIRM|nr:UvrD-helicase domain-containing protein [Butyrivibrio crossotus]EFF69781.1 putative ATP-dependent DNA helicase PcrA [Butyrivibrio crossotus DSM 2876]UWO49905.1 UvrD-helicase domain-containing protein [Butyrivibrio crossotus]
MSIYDKLNEQQKEGVFTTEGAVLILAGAGSGKTGVLTHRIAHLIDDLGVNSYNILAITFTNKAAKEMKERVDRLVGMGADSAWIMTFHAACVRILRRYICRIGYDNNFTIYDTDDQKSVIKDILKRKNLDPKQYKDRTILSVISNAKDNLISPDDMYQSSGGNYNTMKTAEIYREYQEQLKKNNAVDFDDIIGLTVKLFNEDKEVLRYYQERFRYIMVDEYQDTNRAQFNLIRLLAGGHGNLCVVGDDDQSIYKFRGADINNILDFEKYFNDAKIIKLEQNYRSTQKILDVANEVIKNNSGRKDKRLWTSVKDGTKVIFNVYENGYEEARGIAEDIAHRHLHDRKDYSDFAILYRTNAQSRSLEEKLIEKNIPYRIYGGINFYARREIKDILAYLKTIDNARDDLAVKRILNVPKRGIGAASVAKVDDYAYENDITFYVALRQAKEVPGLQRAVSKVEGFVTQIEILKSKSQYIGVGKLIEEIIETVGYSDYIDAESESDEQATERRQNIDELISKAVQYEETVDEPSLSGFLEEVALVADIDNLDENNDMVSLMTIHSAKGLEFPIVYLAGMEDGLFPSYMSISTGDESDIEEERRLCYVGITRAKETLIMSAARMRTVRGETQMNRTSRFVREIPKELLAESAQMLKKNSEYSSITGKDHMELPVRKRGQVAFNSYQREAISNTVFDKKTDSAPDYVVGDRVRHIKFGEGTVADMINGGRDYEVTVDFDTAGRKKMFAGFAKLVKI